MIKVLTTAVLFAQMIGIGNHRKIFPAAGGGITYVGTCDNAGTASPTTACTYASVPSGATIAIGVSGASGATSVSDSVNGAATQVGSNLSYNGGSSIGNIWYIKNATAGSHVITATFSGTTNFTRLKVMVFSGANATTPLDPFTGTQGTGSASATNLAVTSSFPTANASEMVAAFVWAQGGPSISSTPVSPYTTVVGVATATMGSVYGIQTTAGTYTASANLSASGAWGIMAMALKQ